MKFQVILLAALTTAVSAFVPAVNKAAFLQSRTQLEATPGAAKSKEEDLEKTIKIIMDHLDSTMGDGVIDDEVPSAPSKVESEE